MLGKYGEYHILYFGYKLNFYSGFFAPILVLLDTQTEKESNFLASRMSWPMHCTDLISSASPTSATKQTTSQWECQRCHKKYTHKE
ncbi:hypothetical protein [Flagellimonas eckloniae]|uniref:Uncharacterized protein n=1 Tax=Flagellimonas eckloniae TaxID=346185 RepID=A0A0Q1C108_9FLAO|nr:hypothetical protein [Allomuricauda eckloniae]KQC30862.1 hypothetical protein AAY42_13920 [Allomuricauda eckloniae]